MNFPTHYKEYCPDTLSLVRRRYCLVFFMAFLCFNCVTGQDLATLSKQKPFTFHGTAGIDLMGYQVSGIPPRGNPFSFVASANATVSFYGIELPFSISISDKQKSYSQPFNQFGLSPHWKWITLHLGYRNVTFSDFTLAGKTFVGGGIELNPSIFRFGFLYGRFNRSTTESPVFQNDSLPQYRTKGYAVKLGLGTANDFFDLILLHIRDDSTSLKQKDTLEIRTPQQNVVIGFNSHFLLGKHFFFDAQGAFSLMTTNLGAEKLSDVENNSTLHSINKFLAINQSSEYYTAVKAAFGYKSKYAGIKFEYNRIDPKYQSLGAYFFNNDIERFTLSPSLYLFKRKLIMQGSAGYQHDNLRKTKKATSSRLIGNANLSWNPSTHFGLDAAYSNYSINQKAGRISLVDSTKVIQTTQNISLTPRLVFYNANYSHMVLVVLNLSDFNDKNKFTSEYTKYTSQTGMFSYILGLIPSRWSFSVGVNYLSMSSSTATSTGYGGSLGVTKSLAGDKLSLSWTNSVTRNKMPGGSGYVLNSNLSGNYRLSSHHAFRLSLFYTGNQMDSGAQNPSFTEFKGDLNYVYTF